MFLILTNTLSAHPTAVQKRHSVGSPVDFAKTGMTSFDGTLLSNKNAAIVTLQHLKQIAESGNAVPTSTNTLSVDQFGDKKARPLLWTRSAESLLDDAPRVIEEESEPETDLDLEPEHDAVPDLEAGSPSTSNTEPEPDDDPNHRENEQNGTTEVPLDIKRSGMSLNENEESNPNDNNKRVGFATDVSMLRIEDSDSEDAVEPDLNVEEMAALRRKAKGLVIWSFVD